MDVADPPSVSGLDADERVSTQQLKDGMALCAGGLAGLL
jgi:hypothetical protein